MKDIQYVGEWLSIGNLGHLFSLIGLFAAVLASISFWQSVQTEQYADAPSQNSTLSASWLRMGRIGFGINAFSVFMIGIILFYLIFNHRFEFKYVWQHSSTSLPVYYMISCFWEGQEGSFWLWQFWTAALGLVAMFTAGKWQSRVMTVVGLMQVFLAAMLIGIYFFGYKIGSSPFILFRMEQPEMPLFARADYVDFIKDGNGLNPLLQNYWMVIHPPTLFLGFAATLMPAAYCMAALWRRDFGGDWIKPTMLWSLFAGAILGTGVLMGGAWAYEALSFGGFWAWDPVENASLVPWITLIAGIHTLLAYKHSGHALHATVILLISTLWLILYSTFLTRSGVLGDTSVHSFTDLGMSGQLLTFLFTFIILSVVLLVRGWQAMPSPEKEEKTHSREFWLFIGSLVMLMLALIVIIDTSWPVINKIFGTNRAIADAITHYNRYTIWFGVVIALLSASIQYFRYRSSDWQQFARRLVLPTVLALVFTGITAYYTDLSWWAYVLFLFTAYFSVFANLNYLIAALNGKIRVAGGSVAHIGFGLILVGILLSSAKKEVISLNTLGIDYGKEFKEKDKAENVLLYKNKPIQMNEYWVTYMGDSTVAPNTYYKVRYEKKANKEDTPSEVFTLHPNAQINPNMGLLANPSTKHYWTRDIFTHVSSVAQKQDNDTPESLTEMELAVGDTAITNGSFVVLKAIDPHPAHARYLPLAGDIAAGAQLEIIDINGKKYDAKPIYYIRDNTENSLESDIADMNMTIKFDKILPEQGKVKLSVIERDPPEDFIIMKAIVFPYINVLWLGSFVMVVGFGISFLHRRRERVANRQATALAE
jgi:cytochrome c-type biogenesis protein CcmF